MFLSIMTDYFFFRSERISQMLVILIGFALIVAFRATAFPQRRHPKLMGANPLLTLEDANDPSISFDGKRMAVLPEIGVIEIYDVKSKRKMRSFKVPFADESWISSDGKRVAISGMIQHFTDENHYIPEPKLWIYDIESGNEVALINTYVEANSVKTRNLDFGKIYGSLSSNLRLAVSSLIRGDEEQRIANGGVWLWDIASKKLIGSFGEYQKDDSWQEVKITPDASVLVASYLGFQNKERNKKRWGTIVWNTQQQRELLRFPFYSVSALSDNGKRLATTHSKSDDTEVTEIWDVTTGKRISEIGIEFKTIKPPRFANKALSPDGKLLATGNDNFVLIWDTDSGRLLAVQQFATTSDEDAVGGIIFNGNGQYLVVEGQGETIKVWLLNDILKSATKGVREYRRNLKRPRPS